MFLCKDCGEAKPRDSFTWQTRNGRESRSSYCKPCAAARTRRWKAGNADRARAKDKAYREKNRDKLLAQKKAQYAANKQAYIDRARAWEKANPEKRKELRANYRERNRDRLRAWNLAYYYERMEREPDVIRAYRLAWQKTEKGALLNRLSNHKRRGVRYDKEGREYAAILVNDPCSYCGGPGGEVDHISPVARGGSGHWSNLTGACRGCNSRKNDRHLLEMIGS